jgi:uncharacterized membrane protein
MIFAPVFSPWLILLLLLLGLAAVSVQYLLIRKRLGSKRAALISFLRLLALALLISFALNPSRIERREYRPLPSLAVLIDTSQSMNQPGAGGKSRLDEAKSLLLEGQAPLLGDLLKRFDVTLYSAGESLQSLDLKDLATLKAGGKEGRLSEALDSLKGKSVLALVLSDGSLIWEEAKTVDLPLFILPLGDPKGYRDVLIQSLRAPAIGFRGKEVRIDVSVKSYGYPGLNLPVVLKEGNKVLAAQNVRLSENPAEARLSLSFTPERVGQHALQVSIPAQAGENISSNNAVSFSLNVLRDKIRILMVSGNPSMNYRFLRAALKNDPSIDLLSFVILRTPTNILNVPLQEQSLIPFPVETLFSKELGEFDLLIFDNLASHLYIPPGYLGNIRDFVRKGGGFAMLGGSNLLDGGRYGRTPIEEILPVRVAGRDNYRQDSPYGVKLSRAGVGHPMTRLLPNENENLGLWREMPALGGINLLEPRSYKNVLLESSDGASRPILAAGSYGKGRVLVFASDSLWRWSMGMVSKGKGNWPYLRLVERMVRWLTRDPSLDPVQIELTNHDGEPGQAVEVRIKVREEDPSSSGRSPVSFSVLNSDGNKIASELKGSGQSGEYVGSFLPDKEGMYRVRAESAFGVAEESIVVKSPFGDLDAYPNHEKLRKIAAATGGRVIQKSDELLKEIEAHRAKGPGPVVEERTVPLWGGWPVLVLLLLLLGTEWYLRRKWGMV